jgi:hypothetical protein
MFGVVLKWRTFKKQKSSGRAGSPLPFGARDASHFFTYHHLPFRRTSSFPCSLLAYLCDVDAPRRRAHPHHPLDVTEGWRRSPWRGRRRRRWRAMRQTGVSLRYMMEFGARPTERTLLLAAQFLHKELPIRIARRALDLDSLPFGLSTKPAILKVSNRPPFLLRRFPA